ncbi:hypothetical protein [Halorientalis sp.]|jgi:hypothetical protein|uniref:hypothetical protein n=1 Tax=Halorientalis sp. TaxID=1931229 RepID=UPI00260ACBF5|nr:hypothetical protein [Halorientalis sp.]
MKNPRAMGIPPLVLGILMLQSSVSALFGTSLALDDLSWVLNVPGAIFGVAATAIGVVLVLNLDEYVTGRSDS